MKKKNIKSIVIFGGVGIIILVFTILVFVFNSNNEKEKYEYIASGYGAGSSLIIDDTVYVEIIKDDFDLIKKMLESKGIEQLIDKFIVRLEYPFVDATWKYVIYGSENKEIRILLHGEESSFWSSNSPDIYFCRIDVLYKYLNLIEYKYQNNGDSILGDGITYKEIDKTSYEILLYDLIDQNIYGFAYINIGRISYTYDDEWKLILYGQIEQRERILLRGKERYAFYDKDYPEVYYCREDIFNLFYEMNGSLDGVDLREYMK